MGSAGNGSNNLKYSSLGTTLITNGAGDVANFYRDYVPGNSSGFLSTVGPTVAAFYSTGKFLPGTCLEWIPSVGFTTNGQISVGFTDNPEVMAVIASAANTTAYIDYVKGLGDVQSWPIYDTRMIQVPTKLRRKMFDVNIGINPGDPNVLDRSAQIGMFAVVTGCPITTSVGNFRFIDNLIVEGLQSVVT